MKSILLFLYCVRVELKRKKSYKLKFIFLIVILGCFNSISYDQIKAPLSKIDADKPGNYEVVVRVSRINLYDNDSLIVDLFITGYGRIGNGKLFVIPSGNIFCDYSVLKFGFTRDDNTHFHWGDSIYSALSSSQFVVPIAGPSIGDSAWPYQNMFLDDDTFPENSSIITEMYSGPRSPYQFCYKIKKNVQAGDYSIKVYLTYYNSREWKTSKEIIPIHINTVTEEYAGYFAFAGIIIGLLGIIGIKEGIKKTRIGITSLLKMKPQVLSKVVSNTSSQENINTTDKKNKQIDLNEDKTNKESFLRQHSAQKNQRVLKYKKISRNK